MTQPLVTSTLQTAIHTLHETLWAPHETRSRVSMVATNIYLRTAAGWRMILHHASHVPGQPEAVREGAAPKILH